MFLIQQNIHDMKMGIRLDNGTTYFLNDKTINQLMKNKIEDEHLPDGNRKDGDYQEMVNLAEKTESITLFRVENPDKSRLAGGFFKYLNITDFDLDRYGVHKEIRRENYNENCLYMALKNGGMNEIKLEKLKLFVMNRIVPKCKLNEIGKKLDIYIKLLRLNNDLSTRVEYYGDKESKEKYNIGLIDEHYFILEQTNLSSYCLTHYEEIKDMTNCNNTVKK